MRPTVIGIMGGIASGKTTVAEMLGSFGARVIDADEIGHGFLDTPEVKEKLVERWGKEILDEGGGVDRDRLSRLVFSDAEALRELNDTLHPLILEAIHREIAGEGGRIVVLDAALLHETGLTELCDLLLFVAAEKRVKEERAVKQRRWKPEEVARRERFQAPVEEKRKIAHCVIDNNFSKEETLKQVKEFLDRFVL
ncbi:MAG: dephospho-CoA kinase [Candidatus Brocadiales bacterium]